MNRHEVDGRSCHWDYWFYRFNVWSPEKGNYSCPHTHDTLADRIELILRRTVYSSFAGPVGGISNAVTAIVELMEDER